MIFAEASKQASKQASKPNIIPAVRLYQADICQDPNSLFKLRQGVWVFLCRDRYCLSGVRTKDGLLAGLSLPIFLKFLCGNIRILLKRWRVNSIPRKERVSGYLYPPLSANFSMTFVLAGESVRDNTPSVSGVYELRLKGKEIDYPNGKTDVIYIGSAKNLRKRIREHLNPNTKNGGIRDFLKNGECSFRYLKFPMAWREEEAKLYSLFLSTYGAAPRCNKVRPYCGRRNKQEDK